MTSQCLWLHHKSVNLAFQFREIAKLLPASDVIVKCEKSVEICSLGIQKLEQAGQVERERGHNASKFNTGKNGYDTPRSLGHFAGPGWHGSKGDPLSCKRMHYLIIKFFLRSMPPDPSRDPLTLPLQQSAGSAPWPNIIITCTSRNEFKSEETFGDLLCLQCTHLDRYGARQLFINVSYCSNIVIIS